MKLRSPSPGRVPSTVSKSRKRWNCVRRLADGGDAASRIGNSKKLAFRDRTEHRSAHFGYAARIVTWQAGKSLTDSEGDFFGALVRSEAHARSISRRMVARLFRSCPKTIRKCPIEPESFGVSDYFRFREWLYSSIALFNVSSSSGPRSESQAIKSFLSFFRGKRPGPSTPSR
jgi:hypothetical protein